MEAVLSLHQPRLWLANGRRKFGLRYSDGLAEKRNEHLISTSCLRAFQGPAGYFEMVRRKKTFGDRYVCCDLFKCLLIVKCMAQSVLDAAVPINNVLLGQHLTSPRVSTVLVRLND